MEAKKIFNEVYKIDGKIATLNLVRGKKVYNEVLVDINGIEYRLWNPYRSKLSAAILKGLKTFAIKKGSYVLYLGASTGTTSSHVSDIVGIDGRIYAVEISERSMRDLIKLCEIRNNMLPILEDASHPDRYAEVINTCDIIYQDVSAKNQVEILRNNSRFLKKGGIAYFIIKSQSIDISRPPEKIFEESLQSLSDIFDVVEKLTLEPYDNMHMFAVLKKR
ncbi:MAG: fibrillarin-like rRNA/tRNA 2'-O-methyltransferase [Candidatus Marsarchaeota archaeon]|jgi:rRNA 2''-O-methyltransferase fibrillarin (EC 2.1.1.-)|nr:fibrillarin-like rRNA/tRNA 2'-O-methyltransferase [Candidatus Marsarchaeota archaeon]